MPELGPSEGLDFLKEGKDGVEMDDEDDEEAAAQGPVCDDEPADTGDKPDQLPEETQDFEEDANVEEINEAVESLQLQEPERDAKEVMDELLENAFLQAWKTSAKKIDLPILTSNFFRVHMVPQCPKDSTLDPKKSSYKKLSKFLEHMQKQKIIAIKELQKGVESIVQVEREHQKIQSFRVVKFATAEPVVEDNVLPAAKAYEPPVIEELLTVNAAVLPLFKQMGRLKGDALSHAEVRDLLRQFVTQKNLRSATDKAGVTLDETLKDLVLTGDERRLEVATMKWDELMSRIQAKMSSAYSVHFPGSAAPLVHKGKMEAIELSVHSRSGNKKVTLIHNLEPFGLDPKEVAHRCQVGVAASTSVGAAENRKPGSVEVLVQGNQLAFISKLLLNEYKIPRKFINGLEEPQKKKKGK
jgi:translation initiation factor 2D